MSLVNAYSLLLSKMALSQGDLIDNPQFEGHHAVRHELHGPVDFGDKRIISFAFSSDDSGQAALGVPVVEAVNLPPLRERIVQQTQKRIDRIEHDSSGSSRVGLDLDSSEHSTQVEFAGLDHVRFHLGIKKEELLLFQFREVPPEACGVCQNVAGVLFEGDEDARLAELARPVDQCLQGENGFSAPRTA